MGVSASLDSSLQAKSLIQRLFDRENEKDATAYHFLLASPQPSVRKWRKAALCSCGCVSTDLDDLKGRSRPARTSGPAPALSGSLEPGNRLPDSHSRSST